MSDDVTWSEMAISTSLVTVVSLAGHLAAGLPVEGAVITACSALVFINAAYWRLRGLPITQWLPMFIFDGRPVPEVRADE
ncbi:hypothetical protein [Haloarchaeobius litoreus]|uniref:Uncharacterized protein n=1 Tax=Haloarchaeobius litoreus TaxID=755306 RepID=A0ABD6DN37_9EURY|nr:hypothetical protein [Haloarchaeobius litoreus]